MNIGLQQLELLIERTTLSPQQMVYPFDGLFLRLPPPLVEAYVLHEAIPRVPRRLVIEAAIVTARQVLGQRDQTYLARAEALPSLAAPDSVIERVAAHVLRGRARMEHAREGRPTPGQVSEIVRGAREDLDLAIALIEQHRLPPAALYATLVSAGNAWRTAPHASPADAISRYERARSIGSSDHHERARLAKCHADGLIARGEPADFDLAAKLLRASLKVRRGGPLESETLLSLAHAEGGRRGERTPEDCECVHRILLEAERRAPKMNEEFIARQRVDILAAWLRLVPDASEPRRALDAIAASWPSLLPVVTFARAGGRQNLDEPVGAVMRASHPALNSCIDALLRIGEGFLASRSPSGSAMHIGPRVFAEVEEFFREHSIANDPERLAAMARDLRDAPPDDATPGRLVARALAMTRLVLLKAATREMVESAAYDAESALSSVIPPEPRVHLLLYLAAVWGPSDLAHPVQDFAKAARLSELAMKAAESDPHLRLDAMLYLARKTQHRTDGDLRAHRERATALYEEIIRLAPALGAHANLLSAQQNLAALATNQGTGAREDRTRAALLHQQASADLGSVVAVANRAWEFTMLASRHGPSKGAEYLRQAIMLYESIPLTNLSEGERLNIDHNRTVAETMALEFAGRTADAAAQWRTRLEDPDVLRRPPLLARTRHNLGDLLTRASSETTDEGLRLLQQVLQVRTLADAPREHWETCLSIVIALGTMLSGQRPWAVPMPRRDGLRRAVSAARNAVAAGRRLGAGEELARAGQHLCQLALMVDDGDVFKSLMEEGWRALSDALPCMLDDEESAVIESRLATHAAIRMFKLLESGAVVGLLSERFPTLRDAAASSVRVWVERAMLPQQRRLAARFARPGWCDDATWASWCGVLDAKKPLEIADWIEHARVEHPGFLAPEGSDVATDSWLSAGAGRGAIALLPTERGILAIVRTSSTEHAVFMPVDIAELAPSDLTALMAALPDDLTAAVRTEHLSATARETLLAPLMEVTSPGLRHVRFAAAGSLRWFAPSALLPGTAVHASPTLSIRLEDLAPKSIRTRCRMPMADAVAAR